jgi:DNA-binding beta-propeller fold protein YncE
VSEDGYIYVCDTGNQRVLRFAPDGSYVQRVDHELNSSNQPLANPVAVAANDSVAYVADRGRSEIIRYKRRR